MLTERITYPDIIATGRRHDLTLILDLVRAKMMARGGAVSVCPVA